MILESSDDSRVCVGARGTGRGETQQWCSDKDERKDRIITPWSGNKRQVNAIQSHKPKDWSATRWQPLKRRVFIPTVWQVGVYTLSGNLDFKRLSFYFECEWCLFTFTRWVVGEFSLRKSLATCKQPKVPRGFLMQHLLCSWNMLFFPLLATSCRLFSWSVGLRPPVKLMFDLDFCDESSSVTSATWTMQAAHIIVITIHHMNGWRSCLCWCTMC